MVQCGWETWAIHRVAGCQGKYHRIVQMELELYVKATESRSESHFGKFLYLQYAAIQENDGHPVAASSLEMRNLITCTISSSETGDEEIRDKIRWKIWELKECDGLEELIEGKHSQRNRAKSTIAHNNKIHKEKFSLQGGQNHHINS